jgi:hypothetical protein
MWRLRWAGQAARTRVTRDIYKDVMEKLLRKRSLEYMKGIGRITLR